VVCVRRIRIGASHLTSHRTTPTHCRLAQHDFSRPKDWPKAWFNIEIVSPWRAPHVPRYIAGVEIASGEYFNPVDPADVASRLRALV
jgi:galactose-1-phosphate uridylyltransferase